MARKLFPYERESFSTQKAGTSHQRQKEMITAVAAEYNATVDDSYALDDRGVSGYSGKNVKKKLGLFLCLCKEGVVRKGDILCIERVNRLSRMVWTEQVKLWEEILSYGVEIVTCEPRGHYTSKNIGRLEQGCQLAIQMMLGHQESQQKSDWVKYAHKVARDNAIAKNVPHGRKPPSWLRPVGVPHPLNPKRRITTGWEIIEERRLVIRQIHQWCWEEDGAPTILRKLIDGKVPCWCRGGHWTQIMVKHLLTSRALIGFCSPNVTNYKCESNCPEPYRNYPPILEDEEFERTRLALRSRRSSGGPKQGCKFNLFRHLLKTKDGRPLQITTSTGENGESYRYLAPVPQTLRVPYEELERIVLGCLKRIKVADIDGSLRADEWTDKGLSLQAELGKLREEHEDYQQQLDELPREKRPAMFVRKVAELEADMERVKAELDEAKLYGDSSGRAEALVDTQAILDYIDGLEDEVAKRAAMERVKMRLPILLEGITVGVSNVRGNSKVVHLKMAYKGGHIDCYHFPIGEPDWPYEAIFDEEAWRHYEHNRCLCVECQNLKRDASWM